MSWVYIKSEPGLWTVGHYDPNGRWHTDSDHSNQIDAGERCAYLNGSVDIADVPDLAEQLTAIQRQLSELVARTTRIRR